MQTPNAHVQNLSTLFEGLFIRSKQLLSWTYKKLQLIEAYTTRAKEDQNLPYVKAGEIYYANLGINIGSEIDKERPVLIFQSDDRFIRQSNMTTVIPISSNTTAKPYRVIISESNITDNQGIKDSSILIQQIRSISKARLSQLCGRLKKQKLDEISNEVDKLLYKHTPLQKEGDAQTTKTYGTAKNIQSLP
jgi:mRNA-degrading endonuclease toxin of MazEF toxin-antitoxin module